MRSTATGGGLRQMALAALFFSIMSLLVRLSGERLPSSMIVLARAAVALVLAYGMVRRIGKDPWGNNRWLLAGRGLIGFGALTCFYYSLTHMPLAEATVIQYMNPVFTALLAVFVLRESMRVVELVSVLASLFGVALVAKPTLLFPGGEGTLPALAVGVAVCGALLSAGAYVLVRKAKEHDHPLVVVFWFPLLATPLSVLPAVKDWIWPTPREWLLLVGVGVSTQIAQVFMTEGLHREPAGRATAVSYLQVIFSAVAGAVVLGEFPDGWSVLGAAIIGASVIGLALVPAMTGDVEAAREEP